MVSVMVVQSHPCLCVSSRSRCSLERLLYIHACTTTHSLTCCPSNSVQQPETISCVTGLVEKEGSLERMGMEGIISDMRAGKQRLQAKYLEAHASAMHHFSDVAAVRTAVEAACSPPQEQAAAKTDDSQGATR